MRRIEILGSDIEASGWDGDVAVGFEVGCVCWNGDAVAAVVDLGNADGWLPFGQTSSVAMVIDLV